MNWQTKELLQHNTKAEAVGSCYKQFCTCNAIVIKLQVRDPPKPYFYAITPRIQLPMIHKTHYSNTTRSRHTRSRPQNKNIPISLEHLLSPNNLREREKVVPDWYIRFACSPPIVEELWRVALVVIRKLRSGCWYEIVILSVNNDEIFDQWTLFLPVVLLRFIKEWLVGVV